MVSLKSPIDTRMVKRASRIVGNKRANQYVRWLTRSQSPEAARQRQYYQKRTNADKMKDFIEIWQRLVSQGEHDGLDSTKS